MPNRKSALKSLRKNKKRHSRNKSIVSELKTRDKKYQTLISENKIDEAKEYLKNYIARLDKAASKKIIHKNKASRKASRLTKRLNSTTAGRTA
jgi:small subunit ribosomal protein S20